MPDSPSPAPSLEDHRRPGSHPSSHRSSSVSSSPAHTESSSDRIRTSLQTPRTFSTHFVCEQFMNHPAFLRPAAHYNGLSMNHALLGLSPNIPPGPKEGDLAHDMIHEAAAHKRNHTDKGESSTCHTFSALTGLRRPPGKACSDAGSVFCHVMTEDFQKNIRKLRKSESFVSEDFKKKERLKEFWEIQLSNWLPVCTSRHARFL